MKYNASNIIVMLLFITGLSACNEQGKKEAQEQGQSLSTRLTAEEVEASGPYLTYDQDKNPVLCWTESMSGREGYMLKYAVFNPVTETFQEPVAVLPSKGTRAHPESMNKVGFKADGTVVALYAVKHPTEENPFAGSIFYTLSTDGGKSWTKAAYLHSDTLPDYGRGYFDLATLPDGEVGAVWLDGRFAEADTGSALFFSKTLKGKGFESDRPIGESTCECCRTDLLADQNGRIHVAYRDITFPASQMGKQVRDMSYSYSDDGGKTFSKAKRISADNWAIEGCPHTGPSLAVDQQGLHAVWFTDGGGSGVYYAHASAKENAFTPRQQLSKAARYPQLISLQNRIRLMVWEEASVQENPSHAGVNSTHQHGAKHGQAAQGSKIMLRQESKDQPAETMTISDKEGENPTHPVVAAVNEEKVLIAWTQGEENTAVFYKIVHLPKP